MIEVIQFFKWVGRSACANIQKWSTEMYDSTITIMSAFPLMASLGWVLICCAMSLFDGTLTLVLTHDRELATTIAYNTVPVIALLWLATVIRVLWMKFKQSQQDIIDRLKNER